MESRDFPQEIRDHEALVSYVPLPEEPDPSLLFLQYSPAYTVQPRADLAPEAEAVAAITAVGELRPLILVPGQRFDAAGTRHGRGGGWYDRFLTQVPASWVRVGLCTPSQFCVETLKRESWDQPVDYVCVLSDLPVWHVTHARF